MKKVLKEIEELINEIDGKHLDFFDVKNELKNLVKNALEDAEELVIKNERNTKLEKRPCGDCENYAEYDGGIKYCSVCGTVVNT